MKKTIWAMAAALTAAVAAETGTAYIEEGGTWNASAAQCVAVRAMSTNMSGTVTVKSVARHTYTWHEFTPETNYVTEARTTVVRRTVTNDVVTAWITNRVSATAVESNFWARAVNETPTNHPYANMVYVTNRVEAVETVTNIVEDVVVGTNVTLKATLRRMELAATNELAALTLAGGFAQTNLAETAVMPGDTVYAEGDGMKGGRLLLLMRK